jgi:hypothetical protein
MSLCIPGNTGWVANCFGCAEEKKLQDSEVGGSSQYCDIEYDEKYNSDTVKFLCDFMIYTETRYCHYLACSVVSVRLSQSCTIPMPFEVPQRFLVQFKATFIAASELNFHLFVQIHSPKLCIISCTALIIYCGSEPVSHLTDTWEVVCRFMIPRSMI